MASMVLDSSPARPPSPSLRDGGLVLALTDDGRDPRYRAVRAAAGQMARRAHGRVLLFTVAPVTTGPGGRPRTFDPSVGRPHSGSRRRDLLIDEAAEFGSNGVEVGVWLARACGPSAIVEAVHGSGADVVLVPAPLPRRCRHRPALDRTLDYFASRIAVPVLSVDADGLVARVLPLVARPAVAEGLGRSRASVSRPMATSLTARARPSSAVQPSPGVIARRVPAVARLAAASGGDLAVAR